MTRYLLKMSLCEKDDLVDSYHAMVKQIKIKSDSLDSRLTLIFYELFRN